MPRNSVFAWLRHGEPGEPPSLVVCNFTPVPRDDYRIGVPLAGRWRESAQHRCRDLRRPGMGNLGGVSRPSAMPWHGSRLGALLTLPPLATLILHVACQD